MIKLTERLKKSKKIISIYATDDKKLILVENKQGTVFSINAKTNWIDTKNKGLTYGYQYHMPIKPNIKTGSGVGDGGGYDDYISFDEIVDKAENGLQVIPNFYSSNEIETIKFETMEEHLKTGVIWKVKIK